MRALTLWQPWASLVATGHKRFETRSWGTHYRGTLLIHAAARKPPSTMYKTDKAGNIVGPPELGPKFVEAAIQSLGVSDFERLPLGALVAMGELVGIARVEEHPGTQPLHIIAPAYLGTRNAMAGAAHELLFGDWNVGRHIWQIEGIVRFANPIPCRGARGLWALPEGVRDAVGKSEWLRAARGL